MEIDRISNHNNDDLILCKSSFGDIMSFEVVDINGLGYNQGDFEISISHEEAKNIVFYTDIEINELLMNSRLSIEITKKELFVGDLVIGAKSYNNPRNPIIGIYLGKKQVYVGNNSKVSCQIVYKLEEYFQTEKERQLAEKLRKLYMDEQIQSISYNTKALSTDYNYGSIMYNTSDSLYLYLGQRNVQHELMHLYVNFKVKTVAQIRFYDFLCGNENCNIGIKKSIINSKLSLYDFSLRSIILIILNGLNGNIKAYKTKKGFKEIIGNINLTKFVDNDFIIIDDLINYNK